MVILRVVFSGYIAFIALLSLIPAGPEMPGGMSDKLAHFGAYALMALIGMQVTATARGRTAMMISLVAVGAGLEAIQAIIPLRVPSGWDLVSNVMGVVAGGAFWLVILRLRLVLVNTGDL